MMIYILKCRGTRKMADKNQIGTNIIMVFLWIGCARANNAPVIARTVNKPSILILYFDHVYYY